MKRILIIGCVILCIIASLRIQYKAQPNPQNMIWSDMQGYYVYLPAVFIYGDFTQEALRDTGFIKAFPGTDKIYTKYTSGVAILEMPFFLIAHAYQKVTGGNTDGKNEAYGRALMIAGLFYFWLAMWILYRLGRRYYSSFSVLLALLGIGLGTNLFYYTMIQPAMSHVYSFALFAAFCYLTDEILIQKKPKKLLLWMLYGFIAGMMVMTRPTAIIMMFYPLYIIHNGEKSWVDFITENRKSLIYACLCGILPFIPQIMYWHYVSGDWFIWSYVDEGFKYWREPRLIRVLFDAWNGWILYSPIVIFPIYFLWKNRITNSHHERASLYILLIATYVFASWWAWWFGGAFGHRSFVEYTAILILPFAGFAHMTEKKSWMKYSFVVVVLVLCYYNIGLTYAYNPPWDGEAWTYASWWNEVKKLFLG